MMWRFWDASSSAVLDRDDLGFGRHMGTFVMGNGAFPWVFGLFWLVTWVLVIAALVALTRWLWKKGNK